MTEGVLAQSRNLKTYFKCNAQSITGTLEHFQIYIKSQNVGKNYFTERSTALLVFSSAVKQWALIKPTTYFLQKSTERNQKTA